MFMELSEKIKSIQKVKISTTHFNFKIFEGGIFFGGGGGGVSVCDNYRVSDIFRNWM